MCVRCRGSPPKHPPAPLSLHLSPIHPPGSRPAVPASQPAGLHARRAPRAGPTARARARSRGGPPGRGWRPRAARRPWTRRSGGRGRECGGVGCVVVGVVRVSRVEGTKRLGFVFLWLDSRGLVPSRRAQARPSRVPIPDALRGRHPYSLPGAHTGAHNSPCRQPLGCAERGADDAAHHCSGAETQAARVCPCVVARPACAVWRESGGDECRSRRARLSTQKHEKSACDPFSPHSPEAQANARRCRVRPYDAPRVPAHHARQIDNDGRCQRRW